MNWKEHFNMSELGALNDLPEKYIRELINENTLPLWPFLRGFIPLGKPERQTVPFRWEYKKLKPLLLQAGDLAPIEKAERRVLILCNPGFPAEDAKITSTLYAGLQLVKPKEIAPNHRHTPSAIRMVVEGDGGFTSVNGIKQPMNPGDLILTPTGTWHEHGHNGIKPIIWLDVLDLPLVYGMGASYSEEGQTQRISERIDSSQSEYYSSGIVPYEVLDSPEDEYPLIRFPWVNAKKSLDALALNNPIGTPTRIAYINPTTGKECLPSIGLSALLVRPGETLRMPKTSCSAIYKVIVGEGEITIDSDCFTFNQHDVFSVPNFAEVDIHNPSSLDNCYIFIADDAPLHRKLGILESKKRY